MKTLISSAFLLFALLAPAPTVSASDAGGTDTAQLKELRQMLEEAKKLQEQQKALQDKAAAGKTAPAKAGEASAEPAEKEKKKLTRPGCMYSGRELIWEKVPGTCES